MKTNYTTVKKELYINKVDRNKHFYYCDNGHILIQWKSNNQDAQCPICNHIGTYGKYY